MSRPHPRAARSAIAIATLAVLLAACGTLPRPVPGASPSDSVHPTRTEPTWTADSRAGATAVCSAFSRAYVEVDGGADPSEATARQRAAVRYGTPTLSAALDDPQSRSEEWPLLVEHRAIVVTTELPFEGQAPPDTSDRAYDAVVLDREAVGADGWRMRLPSVTIFCTSVRASDGWRVDKVDLSLGGTS